MNPLPQRSSGRPHAPRGACRSKLLGFMLSMLVALGGIACLPLLGGVVLGILMSQGDGVVQHHVMSPDGHVAAVVVRDDCGATCRCQLRVDLQRQEHVVREVYRNWEACAATVTWIAPTVLQIEPEGGQKVIVDLRTLGMTP